MAEIEIEPVFGGRFRVLRIGPKVMGADFVGDFEVIRLDAMASSRRVERARISGFGRFKSLDELSKEQRAKLRDILKGPAARLQWPDDPRLPRYFRFLSYLSRKRWPKGGKLAA